MNIEEIKTLAIREPFRPFTIVLESGREVLVTQDSELLFPSKAPQLVIVFSDEGMTCMFEAQAVSAIEV